MRVDRNVLGWGVFFLAAGAIALALEGGVLADRRWWTLWPLILVGAGLGLVLRRTPVDWLGGLVVAGTFGVIVGGSLAGGFGSVGDVTGGFCRGGDGSTPFADRSGAFDGSADVAIELDCGTVDIGTTAGSGWMLQGSDDDGRGPDVDAADHELRIEPAGGLTSASWSIKLPTEPRLDVRLQLNAGQLRAAFPGARLEVVDLEANAGSAVLDLTDVDEIEGIDVGVNAGSVAITLPSRAMTGGVEANAGSVRLCAPDDVALRLETQVALGSVDVGDSGLQQVEGGWQSPDYDTASTRIELRVQANLGSVRLDPAEGCT